MMDTQHGQLIEIPVSALTLFGFRLGLFGGGYLRLSSMRLMRWGINRLKKAKHPLIVYIHPREVDPNHPRLQLGVARYFRSYYNLKSAMPKLEWLCQSYNFGTMHELVDELLAR